MDDLIKRLEEAKEGSRVLDRKIHGAVVGYPSEAILTDAELPEGFGGDDLSDALDPTPHYTTSLDAALTLVPWNTSIQQPTRLTSRRAKVVTFIGRGWRTGRTASLHQAKRVEPRAHSPSASQS